VCATLSTHATATYHCNRLSKEKEKKKEKQQQQQHLDDPPFFV
jgi:hypothetical protein